MNTKSLSHRSWVAQVPCCGLSQFPAKKSGTETLLQNSERIPCKYSAKFLWHPKYLVLPSDMCNIPIKSKLSLHDWNYLQVIGSGKNVARGQRQMSSQAELFL